MPRIKVFVPELRQQLGSPPPPGGGGAQRSRGGSGQTPTPPLMFEAARDFRFAQLRQQL